MWLVTLVVVLVVVVTAVVVVVVVVAALALPDVCDMARPRGSVGGLSSEVLGGGVRWGVHQEVTWGVHDCLALECLVDEAIGARAEDVAEPTVAPDPDLFDQV